MPPGSSSSPGGNASLTFVEMNACEMQAGDKVVYVRWWANATQQTAGQRFTTRNPEEQLRRKK
jgi:hypothetical protein